MKSLQSLLFSVVGLTVGVWLGLISVAKGQTREIDSLRHVLQTAPSDTTRAQAAHSLVRRFVTLDTTQAWRYAWQGLRLSRQAGDSATVAASYLTVGNLYDFTGRGQAARACYQQARQLYQQAYNQTKSASAQRGLAAAYIDLSNTYSEENNYGPATALLLRAVDPLVQVADSDLLTTTYHNLAGQFFSLGQLDKALQYSELSIKLAEARHDVNARFNNYLSTATVLLQLRRYGQADSYLRRARQLLPRVPNSPVLYDYYQTMGDYHAEVKEYAAAAANYERAIPYVRQHHELSPLATLYHSLGLVKLKTRRPAEAAVLFRQAAAIFKQIQAPASQAEELRQLADTEEQLGHPTQALHYYKRYQHLADSLDEKKTQRQINVLENKYQAQQKERQIASLRHKQELQALELKRETRLNLVYLSLVLALVVAGALGYVAVRNRQQLARQTQLLQAQQLQELKKEQQLLLANAVLQGQEDERRRLARDLHDGLGGMLSTIKLYLARVQDSLRLPEPTNQLFTMALQHLDGSINELRRVAHNLMPEVLLRFGLPTALQQLCAHVHRTQQLDVQCQVFGLEKPLDQHTEVTVYRMVQELVNNAVKHAQATQVMVQLMRHDNQVNLVVEDNGQGFAAADAQGPAGLGLKSIQARVNFLSGRLEIQSDPGHGTSVFLEFPAAA